MKYIIKVVTIFCIMSFVAVQVQAQDKKWVSGNAFNLGIPIGDMATNYDFGYGIYFNLDHNFNKFLVGRFDFGWNSFSGPDKVDAITGLPEDVQIDVWEFTAGLRAKVAIFYVEARGGYFTGISSWGVVPAVGLRLGSFDVQGNLTVAGDNHWSSVRIAYYWGG